VSFAGGIRPTTAGRRRATVLAQVAILVAALTAVVSVAGGGSAAAADSTATYRPLAPCRLLDTRVDAPGRLADGGMASVHVAGRCGVPADATAVALTVAALSTSGPGFVTIFPSGADRPLASTLNYERRTTRANGSIVAIGADGMVDLYTLSAADLVVDVTGAWVPAASATSGRFVPTTPTRLLDTRSGPRPGDGSVLRIMLPADVAPDASAVALNVAVTEPTSPGFATLYPAGGSRPLASNLNWDAAGQVRAATTIVPVTAEGVDLYVLSATHVVVDITGWFTGDTAEDSADGLFVALTPTRVLDSRLAAGPTGGPRLWTGGSRELNLAPWVGRAAAVATNLTVVSPDGPGWWLAYPAGTPAGPTGSTEASSINTDAARQVVANLAVVPLSDRGLGLHARTTAHIVVDLTGWFTGAPAGASLPVPVNVNRDRVVTIVSDSGSAGIRWNGALGGLRGFRVDARLESCRRLIVASCHGREGYTPRTALQELSTLPRPRPSDILVVATGYNDWSSRFAGDFDTVVAAARSLGFEQIAWMRYRGSADPVHNAEFRTMNAILDAKLASGAYTDVELWDLPGYTAGATGWFTADGIHQLPRGSWGVADWISRHVAHADARPCPVAWAAGLAPDDPCPWPDALPATRGLPDIRGLYGA
jgi:hypothetical protein